MRLSLALLLPAIAGVAQAATASVQGFVHGERIDAPKNVNGLVLTPRQLRLVVAANLGLSQYHALADESHEIDSTTVDAINELVERDQRTLYDDIDDMATSEPGRYLSVVRGSSEEIEAFKKINRKAVKEAYPFSLPESSVRLEDLDRLVADLKAQAETTDSDIYEIDLSSPDVTAQLKSHSSKYHGNYLSTILLINTDTITTSHAPANAIGSYSMPNAGSGKRQSEAPMSESFRVASVSSDTPSRDSKKNATTALRRLPALCYASLDACTGATNNCSGHGECFRKYGPVQGSGQECFACGCVASFEKNKTTYWGGAACQKEDVSSQFWILAGFSVLLMGLVGWAIGMMFSIGNEKLPGVIGAGVAPKTR